MSDPRFTPETIRPLVAHERPTGRHLVVTFRCPQSGTQINARWTAPQSSGVVHEVAARAKHTAWYEARRQVHSLLRSVLGTGAMGRIATDVVSTAMNTAAIGGTSAPGLSTSEQEQGLVEAFRSVSTDFAWTGDRWVHRSVAAEQASDLDRQLAAAPLTHRYDRLLLARMLTQIAGAHRGIGDEERSYLADAIDPDLGSLEALQARPPLTAAEIGEASPGENRASMLTLAWTLALVDEHHAVEEVALLDTFGEQLGLPATHRARARDLARTYLVDQALERAFAWGGHDEHARNEVYALGDRIGMSREDVELAEAKFQRRRATT